MAPEKFGLTCRCRAGAHISCYAHDTRLYPMQVQGKRRRGRPKKRWLENIREDMKEFNVTEEMVESRSVWHMKIKAGPLLHRGGI